MKTVKIAEVTHEQLSQFKDEQQHTSFDSAVRELLSEYENDE